MKAMNSTPTPTLSIVSECFIQPQDQDQHHHDVDEEDDKHSALESCRSTLAPFHLTPWDLYLINMHFYIQNGLLFAKPRDDDDGRGDFNMKSLLDSLKSSLSLTLRYFYPVAGRIKAVENNNANPVSYSYHVDCNNSPGVKFVHASMELCVSEIHSPTQHHQLPMSVLQSFFVDDKAVNDLDSKSLLTVTVIELVNGVFLGCSMNHVVADGNSFCHFLNMWSEIFQAGRQLAHYANANATGSYNLSRPPILHRWFPDGHGPIIKVPFSYQNYESCNSLQIETPPPISTTARMFHLSPQAVAKLKAKANAERNTTDISTISSFQALSAFLWRSITRVRNLPPDHPIMFVSPINNRSRLEPPLPRDYFGNSVGIIIVFTTAGELLSNDLGWAAWKLNQAVVNYTDKQVRQWVHDWLQSPSSLKQDSQIKVSTVVANDFTKFKTMDNEFGILGKPLGFYFGNRHKMDDGSVCASSGQQDGSIDLDICLSPHTMSHLLSHKDFLEAVY